MAWVLKGYSPISGLALVIRLSIEDFSAVGSSNQYHLGRALLVKPQSWAPAALPARALLLLLELGHPPFKVRVEMVGTFVLGQQGDHIFQPSDFFIYGFGCPERLLGLLVFATCIRRHGGNYTKKGALLQPAEFRYGRQVLPRPPEGSGFSLAVLYR